MTEAEIKHVAEEAAEGALRKFLLMIGVDVSSPAAMIELQADFRHLRNTRTTATAIWQKVLMVVVGSAVTGIIGAVVYYVTHH